MNVLIEKLPTEIQVWKKAVDDILRADDYHKETNLKLREGEKTIFRKLINFCRFNDFNPDFAKSLTDELKNHEKYHSPKWEDLGTFRRICIQYYTKDQNAYRAFKTSLLKDEDGWLSDKLELRYAVGSYDFYFSDEFENVKEDYDVDDVDSWMEDDVEITNDQEDNLIRITNEDFNSIGEFCQSEGVDFYRDNWTDDMKWIKTNFDKLEIYLRLFHLDFYCCYRGWFVEKTGFIVFTAIYEPNRQLIVCINENTNSKWEVVSPYLNLFADSFEDPLMKKIDPRHYKDIQEGDYLNKRTLKIFDKIVRYINHRVI